LIGDHGNEQERDGFSRLLAEHNKLRQTTNPHRIKAATLELRRFAKPIHWRVPGYHRHTFFWLQQQVGQYTDEALSAEWLRKAEAAALEDDTARLIAANEELLGLLKPERRREMEHQPKVGIQ
jgi:hypothetical protein